MSMAIGNSTLVCLMLALIPGSQSPHNVIRGSLRQRGNPINDAAVFLQSFDDEHCAKIFVRKKGNRRMLRKLDHCTHDVATASADADGHYRFEGQKPGWYAVHFLWNIDGSSLPRMSTFYEGDWVVLYAGQKDLTGKYDTMAQDIPFLYPESGDIERDFNTQR